MKRSFTFLTLSSIALVMLLGAGTLAPANAVASAQTFRWDITHVTSAGVSAGGVAHALAADSTTIKLTDSGTFNVTTFAVSGGGTWATSGPSAGPSGAANGTFKVTEFIRFILAPGSLPPGTPDSIGPNAHSGLAVLKIFYSDGSKGSLVVSCHLPVGSPSGIFEGVTATKDFVAFWERVPPVPGIDANRTVFHQL